MFIKKVSVILVGICFLLPVFSNAQDTLSYVYVSVQGSNYISVYSQQRADGSLTKVYDQTVSGGPASIAVSPNKKFLYVSQRTAKTFSSYSIDSSTGRLTFISSIAAVDNPVNISTDKTGRYLLSAYYAASKAAIYEIDTLTGNINSSPLSTFSTAGINPHAIKTDPSNKYVFLTNMTGNRIQQFTFNASNGGLTANTPALVIPTDSVGPRHFVYHGTKNLVYFSNEIGNSVTVYGLSTETGLLTWLQDISALPEGYTETNKVADIHLTPDNKFLYVSNRGQDAIAAFSIDNDTGLLSSIDYYATQSSPRAFDIDVSGTYLYAAGETSGKMTHYAINKATGALSPVAEYTLGTNPSWVCCLSFVSSPEVSDNCTGMVQLFIDNLTVQGLYTLILYDAEGTTPIKNIVNGTFLSGNTKFYFAKAGLSSGTYSYKLFSGDTVVKSGTVIIS